MKLSSISSRNGVYLVADLLKAADQPIGSLGVDDIERQPSSVREVSDDVLGTVSLAEQGVGICQTCDFIVRERLANGYLVELLPQLNGRARPFSLLYAPHRHQPVVAGALIEALSSAGK